MRKIGNPLKNMTFLLLVAALVASVCLVPAAWAYGPQRGCPGGGGGGGCPGGGQVIDPPIGAAFRDPPEATDINPAAGIVEVNLEAKYATVNVNGANASLMTFNGSYPGPTIRAKSGDIVKIHYKNSLPSTSATNYLGYRKNITNLHTHGWHVSPEAPADYVMYELWPGQTYHHEYDTLLQEPGTLNFYHPHIHGLAAEQYWAGLLGALVVADETPLLANYEPHIMILKDLSLSGTNPAPHSSMMDYMNGKEGSVTMDMPMPMP